MIPALGAVPAIPPRDTELGYRSNSSRFGFFRVCYLGAEAEVSLLSREVVDTVCEDKISFQGTSIAIKRISSEDGL